MTPLAVELERRLPGNGNKGKLRRALTNVCESFVRSNLADPDFESEIASGVNAKFWSRLSEALVYEKLISANLVPVLVPKGGPDFLVYAHGRRVWIEVICPEPVGLSPDWLQASTNIAGSVPHDAILLRWTSAIKEKTEKLLGSQDRGTSGYIGSGVVEKADAYVIAVNGCQLRNGPFPGILGISQLPYAAEAVFPIGPMQVYFDRKTLKPTGRGHQHRIEIAKPSGATVPTLAFMDSRSERVSAIWALDVKGHHAVGIQEPAVVVHNPLTINKVAIGSLPADEDYEAIAEDGGYLFGPAQAGIA